MNAPMQRPSTFDPVAIAGGVQDDQIIDLRAVIGALWRRKWIVMLCAVAFAGLAAFYVLQATPLYIARAQVMINTRTQNVVNGDAVMSGLTLNVASLESELQVIQSVQLLSRVIDKLRLEEDPEFNLALREPSPWADVFNWRAWIPSESLAEFGLAPAEPDVLDAVHLRELESLAVLDAVRGALSVAQEGYSAVFSIRFVSEDPAKAALIANTIGDQYIVDQLEANFEATRRASAWLTERLDMLRRDVETADLAIARFREERTLAEGQGVDITRQQIGELNSRLIVAQGELAEAQARFDQVSRLVSEGRAATSPEVLSSQLIRSLREQEAEVQRRAADLASRYGNRHPDMINVRAELGDLRGAISSEISKIVDGLSNNLEVARSREASLQQSLRQLELKLQSQAETSVELVRLERESEAARNIYDSFLARFKEITQQENFQQADARLINEAKPPLEPFSPRKTLIVAAGGAAGVMLGLMIVALLEYLNNAYQSIARIQRDTGVPVLAALPKLTRIRKRSAVLKYIREKPGSQLAECVRNLRTSILLSRLDDTPKVVMVTSSTPAEGKSTTCMLLAHVSAQLGRSAIIVDCDLRNPTLAETFGVPVGGGLTAVLEGSATLAESILTDEMTGLHILPTRRTVANAADVLSSQRFAQLIRDLREQYDLVLLDAPPTLAVTDARIIGVLADAVICAVRWDVTPRDAVMEGFRQLTDVGVKVTGAIVTLVDFERLAANSDGGYGYYGQYKAYYKS